MRTDHENSWIFIQLNNGACLFVYVI